jgi:hypothetical protein
MCAWSLNSKNGFFSQFLAWAGADVAAPVYHPYTCKLVHWQAQLNHNSDKEQQAQPKQAHN